MRPRRGAVDEEELGPFQRAFLGHRREEPPPDPGKPPALEALVDGVPVAEIVGQVAPRKAGAGAVKDGLEELAVGELRLGTDGRSLGGVQQRFQDGPDSVTQDATHGDSPGKRRFTGIIGTIDPFVNRP